MDIDENKPANQSSSILSSKRKRDLETSGSKVSRTEGFSWWTSLMLGVESKSCANVRSSVVSIKRKADSQHHQGNVPTKN